MSFYLIDKEPKITSYDVIKKLKKDFNIKKAGHSGTLDPFATGLLIIATNNDTKFLERFLDMKKTYEGELTFGVLTDTYDVDGKILNVVKNVNIEKSTIQEIINKKFIGKIKQVPPAYSAVKVNGKRSYDLARQNQDVDLKPVARIIYSFDIKEISKNKLLFKIEVSSGTYIRAIARDLGEIIGIPITVTKLNRTNIGVFSLKQANKITDNKLTKYSRQEMLNIFELKVSDQEMKQILEGKSYYNSDIKNILEFIVINKEKSVLMKRIGKNKYFINKRID